MDPLLLQKQVRDNSDEVRRFLNDLKGWEKDMKRKDKELLDGASDNTAVPPIRSQIKRSKNTNCTDKTAENKEEKRISSYDYSSWDKFDVEKACAEIDNNEKELEDEEEEDSEPVQEETKEDIARSREQAMYEKELGNHHVKEQRWKEAIDCYTRAIQHNQYDAIFYANRALCYLKTKKPKFAETDCTTSIQLDKSYVKAYQRRALARVDIGHLDDARADFQKVLELEPNNSAAKSELARLDKRDTSTFKRKEEECAQSVTGKHKKSTKSSSKGLSFIGNSLREAVVHQRLDGALDVQGAGGDAGVQELVQSFIREEDEEVVAVKKPPHLRSKVPLKLIPVEEVETMADLLWQSTKTEKSIPHSSDRKIEVIETKEAEIPHEGDKKPVQETPSSSKSPPDLEKQKQVEENNSATQRSVLFPKPSQATDNKAINLPPVPKTSVQFFASWKLVKNNAGMRYQFLKQIPGRELSKIFQESLESKEFSEIITSLDADFLEKSESVYPYLLGLSEVKRFSALVMFLSKSEKIVIKKLLKYCGEKEECSKEDLSKLLKLYEVN